MFLLQDHVVSQITLINGEKIWVREEKSPSWANSSISSLSTHSSSDDCNSSTDSINVCVPFFVSTSCNQVSAELDLSTEIMDLNALLGTPSSTAEVLKPQVLVKDASHSLLQPGQKRTFDSLHASDIQTKPGNSLLRSALTGKTSYLMTKQLKQQQQPSGGTTTVTLPTFRPGSESSKIGEQKVEEILLLAKKRTLESNNNSANLPTFSSAPPAMTVVTTVSAASNSSIFSNAGDKLVINTANLLNTAASQLNLAPPSLSTLVPVRNGAGAGDNNNNIKTIPPPPASVISLVVDVGNNNSNNNNNNLNLGSLLDDSGLDSSPNSAKKRILKRQKSTNSTGSSSGGGHHSLIQSYISTSSAVNSANAGNNATVENSNAVNQAGEPRKEARLLHYCPICNKGFKDRYSVNVHVRTHTGEKPFSCALCGKCFRQKAHLAKHHQTHAAKQTTPTTTASVLPNNSNKQAAENSNKLTLNPVSAVAVPGSATIAVSSGTLINQLSDEKIVFPLSPVSMEIAHT